MRFRELAEYLLKLEKTSSRNEITQILSDLFKKSSGGEIDKIVYLLSGQLVPSYQGVVLNLAEKMMFRAIGKAYGVDVEKVRSLFKSKGDLGNIAEELNKKTDSSISINDVYEKLIEITKTGGEGSQEKKLDLMAALLGNLDSLSSRFVARIPVGKLRLGFSDMTILDALSYMLKGDKSARVELESAFNVAVDIGRIAKEAKAKGLSGLKNINPQAGTPIRPSLAERLPSAEKILEKVGKEVVVEPKYDGFRCITGHTPIYTQNKGYISVKDVKVGDMVLTHKGRFRKVLATNKRRIQKGESLFSFQSYLGNKFKITGGHKILVWRDNKTNWVPIEEVSIKDYLVFPKTNFPEKKYSKLPNPHLMLKDNSGYRKIITTNENFYRLLGFWVGDGFTNNYHNTERIGLLFNAKTERSLADEYKRIVENELGIPKISENLYRGTLNVYWRDKPFREWLTKYFRRDWRGKILPEWFAGVSKESFLCFLKGWIESDGTERHGGGYRITTKERDLAMFVQLLALRQNKIVGVRKIRSRISPTRFEGTYYEVIIPGTERKARMLENIVLVKLLKKEQVKRPDPRTNLYNLQVEGDESYCTGMVTLHNCQVHVFKEKNVKQVRLFSRNLENTTLMFPDIVEAVSKIKVDSAIFDGEAIAYDAKNDKFLPFQETVQRKRKHGIKEAVKKFPLRLFIFDILFKNGKNLMNEPFDKRRKILEETLKAEKLDAIEITRQDIVDRADAVRDLIKKYLSEGLEGGMIKKIDSPYKAGARGFHWVKYKKTTEAGMRDTIDCLVMGVNRGKGKRAGFGVGAFLVGVKDKEKFKTVSKIGTGLSDEQWRELNKRSEGLEVKDEPKEYEVDKNLKPDAWMKPSLVVEILADEVTKSPIHSAGLALRFPRLIKFRDDKDPKDATTIKELTNLFEMQKS